MPGDLLICYVTVELRFSGILKVISKGYTDENKSIQIYGNSDFPCFVYVEPILTTDIAHSIPKDIIFPKLPNMSK